MKYLDADVLDSDAKKFTGALIDQWLTGVPFDSFFTRDELNESLYNALQPIVWNLLASDTQMEYEQVCQILWEQGQPKWAGEWRRAWGETQFVSAMREQLNVIQRDLLNDTQYNQSAHAPVQTAYDEEPARLTRYVVRNWLNGIEDPDRYARMEELIGPYALALTTKFWNTPRILPSDDVIYWFDEYMQPSASVFIRKDWDEEKIMGDIEATFNVLEHKVSFEDNSLIHNRARKKFLDAVGQRRGHKSAAAHTPRWNNI